MRKLLILIACAFLASCGSMGTIRRQTGWQQLAAGHPQPSGFGLYSYVLFAHQPLSAADRAKYIAVLRELLAAAPEVEDLMDAGVPRQRINLTLIPVRQHLEIGNKSIDAQARSLLANYDYARAAAILGMYQRPLDYGPYIISARTPIEANQPGAGQHLMQDFTSTTAANVGRWINAFIARARNRDYAAADAPRQLLLELRNAVSVIAELGPAVINGVDRFVDWLTPRP